MEREFTLQDKVYELKSRRSGRTTALAHRLIAELIVEPHKQMRVGDHHYKFEADLHLAKKIMDIVGKLGYEGFEMEVNRRTSSVYITYSDLWRKEAIQEHAKRLGVNKELLEQAKDLGIDISRFL